MMTLAPDDTILIIGAGIGGLALARALTLAGLKCQLFERAAELSAAGAGIMIQTAGMLALREIGLDVAVAAAGEELTIGRNATERGQTLMRSSLSFLKDQFGVPVVALHRSRLQAVLRQSAPSVPLHLDRALAGFTSDATGVTATFTDGTSARGAVLVGADGLRSAVRRQVLGDQPLRYAGYTTWRGIARHHDLGGLAAAEVEYHLGRQFKARQHEVRIDTTLETIAGVGIDAEFAPGLRDVELVPQRRFDQHVGG